MAESSIGVVEEATNPLSRGGGSGSAVSSPAGTEQSPGRKRFLVMKKI